MIPIPILMWYAALTGQPIMVMILPGEMPAISQPAPARTSDAEAVGNCYQLVCKV